MLRSKTQISGTTKSQLSLLKCMALSVIEYFVYISHPNAIFQSLKPQLVYLILIILTRAHPLARCMQISNLI